MHNIYIATSNGKALKHHGILGMKWGIRRTPEQLGHYSAPPNTKKLDNYSGKCYFISESDLDGKTLDPRVPDNYFTKNGYEDSTTKRICFADDVGKCLTALSQNVSGKKFNVYEPDDISKYTVYKPNTKAVPDSGVTGEMWITEPVSVKKVGSIVCTGDDGKDGMQFTYGKNVAELYGWNYKWSDERKHLSDKTLKELGSESTEKGKEFVETIAADYLKEHPNSKLTESDIMEWYT